MNVKWMMAVSPTLFMDKALIVRDMPKIIPTLRISETHDGAHKSNNHRAWQVANGFATADYQFNGNNWYFVFTQTADNRLLVYDVVRKEKGKLRE